MIAAGLGLRRAATAETLAALLAGLASGQEPEVFAILADKAAHPALAALPRRALAVPRARLAGLATPSHSGRIVRDFRTGSVAEALALFAAGPGGRIVLPRQVAADGTVTLALAEGTTE